MTPELAVAYIGELSNDIRGSLVVQRSDTPRLLAGDEFLFEQIVRVLKLTPEVGQLEIRVGRGGLYVASTESVAVAALTGRFALPALVLHDLRSVADRLTGGS